MATITNTTNAVTAARSLVIANPNGLAGLCAIPATVTVVQVYATGSMLSWSTPSTVENHAKERGSKLKRVTEANAQ